MSLETAVQLFESRYGRAPKYVAAAPGRVNLIGEHTDYNEGFVFPAAINYEIVVAAEVTDGNTELYSSTAKAGKGFDAATVEPFTDSWSKYVAGMPWALRKAGHPAKSNLKAVVVSNLPTGSGVSSSAALENVFGVLWNEIDGLGLTNQEIALIGVHCENNFVGMKCGVMDQLASALGKAGQAIFIDTRPPFETRYAPIPDDVQIVLCDTTKARALAGSKYNERRAECEAAAVVLGVKALRDATIEQVIDAKDKLGDVPYRRAKHVVTEDQRCLDFAEALKQGDLELVGQLMFASHLSLQYDYEVSCDELDFMAQAAWNAPGCIGARMTGAGFGGACVALVEKAQTQAFIDATRKGFKEKCLLEPNFLVCEAAEGARVVQSK